MEVVIAKVIVPDLQEVRRQGGAGPILGRFLTGGSWCSVGGVPGTAAGAAELLAAARAAAEQAGLPLADGAEAASFEATGSDRLVLLRDVEATSALPELDRIAAGAAFCLLVTDGSGAGPLLVILYGANLPALGEVPTATVDDLCTTWTDLAGRAQPGGRNLLHERPEAWDPQLERQLTQRLRQLYGE
jgi:hypothetical protein